MKIGYACLTKAIPYTDFKGTIQKNATPDRLIEITTHNLQTLENILRYNVEDGLKMFRLSSDLIPFGSSPVNKTKWWDDLRPQWENLGRIIKDNEIRVSMHPGQYTVLNSPDEDVVSRAVDDLVYHNLVLDSLGADNSAKIIIHIGGVYGDKKSAMDRFKENYLKLPDSIKNRLIIENDDRSYRIEEVLDIGVHMGIPVVFDNLHHLVNGGGEDDSKWIEEAGKTWKERDGLQKIHYSQQNPERNPGAHSETIDISALMDYIDKNIHHDLDIMLEVKDKNLSAKKGVNAILDTGKIENLEKEWSRYKYNVLERSPECYQEIRTLLKDKNSYPVREFYSLLDSAMYNAEPSQGTVINGIEHVWGYFKDIATEKEILRFRKELERFKEGKLSLQALKNSLWRLTERYGEAYLSKSYYFHI
ncbi:UV DNA damage repair endonuclease UvsE [Gudongella sp. DL1XJH-153]|uniref:UV DNA damage repair endonuclease UvsE n=1 Tax=Gudongella sp. DL1XJH-153 TaxID=3409804 RepID=UPI003BB5B21E